MESQGSTVLTNNTAKVLTLKICLNELTFLDYIKK